MLFSPQEVAQNYVGLGKKKANIPVDRMLVLAILAGVFIGIGGISSTTASVSVSAPSLAKLVAGVVFPGGLAMVLVAGSELFTGNCLHGRLSILEILLAEFWFLL